MLVRQLPKPLGLIEWVKRVRGRFGGGAAVVPVDGESAGFPSTITASPAEFVMTVMMGDTRPNTVSRGDQSSRLRERETPKSTLFESAFWKI